MENVGGMVVSGGIWHIDASNCIISLLLDPTCLLHPIPILLTLTSMSNIFYVALALFAMTFLTNTVLGGE